MRRAFLKIILYTAGALGALLLEELTEELQARSPCFETLQKKNHQRIARIMPSSVFVHDRPVLSMIPKPAENCLRTEKFTKGTPVETLIEMQNV